MLKKSSTLKRLLIPVVLVVLSIFLIGIFQPQLASLLDFMQDQQAVSGYLESINPLGPVVLFLLLVAQVFVAIIPGHALMMAGGYAFGPWAAIPIVAASTILGSELAFWLGRRFGRKLICRLVKPGDLQRWFSISERQGALFYFFAFVLPIFPSDLMCYLAGMGKVSPRGFLAANICGRTICAIAITLIGVFGFNPPWQFWAVMVGCVAVFFGTWGIYKRNLREYAK